MKIKLASVMLFFCILFSSCTVQTEFDVYDLCKRYNKLSGEQSLTTADFLSGNDGKLYCFLSVGQSCVLVTVYENENGSLNSVFATVEESQYVKSDLEEVIKTVDLVFGAFNYGDTEKAKKNLTSVGFDNSFEPFCDCFRSETAGKYKMTLYSNEYSFTVCEEKIDLD